MSFVSKTIVGLSFAILIAVTILINGQQVALSLPGSLNQSAPSATSQILVRPKTGVSAEKLELLHKRAGGKPISSIFKLGVMRVSVRDINAEKALYIYRSSNLIDYAEPNYYRKATEFVPNDSFYSSQWGLKKISMGDAWEAGGSSLDPVLVAVLDTGVDEAHEDLMDVLAKDPLSPGRVLGKHFYTDSRDKQASDDNFQDNSGHGTHISGIIAAKTNNETGVAGIALSAKIMPVKVLDDAGEGKDADIAEGMIWAVDNGARVINMSLEGPAQSETLADAVDYAYGKGAILVAATGNYGVSDPSYPAAYDGVIGVGATDNEDVWMIQSNFGYFVDIVAPGWKIWSTYPPSKSDSNYSYAWKSGTSMAAGFVSGLAATILSMRPDLTNDQVEGILITSVDDLGPAGWDNKYGYGRINAKRAVSFSDDQILPTLSIISPINGSKITGSVTTVTATAFDQDSGIAFVDFFLNGNRMKVDTSPPYELSINFAGFQGINRIYAYAYDRGGNSRRAQITCYKQSFVDVEPTYWAFEDIETLCTKKILAGYSDSTFKPTSSVGRAEFIKMLIESIKLPKNTDYRGYFKDIPITHWAWPYIEAAKDAGLVTGYRGNIFLPENSIKRIEMAVVLIKTGSFNVDYSGNPFLDFPKERWGYEYVMSARNAGIITGYPGNYFRPDQAMSRAEAARIISRIVKNSYYEN